MAFEEHVRNARSLTGREVPEAWYEIPVFYFSNPEAVYRDGDEIPMPADTAALDYELELACVIGADGRPEGFTIMNDWSARDLQMREMAVGLGPAKGKDFATSLGPILVSPDELPSDLGMRAIARVNGEIRTDSSTADMHYSWDQLLERRGTQHPRTAARGRDRLGHRRARLHPRARRSALAVCGRRGRARDRGHRRASQSRHRDRHAVVGRG